MNTLTTIISSLLISMTVFAHDGGPGVTNAKAIELSAHRIDRLVTLGKIDASFLKKLEKSYQQNRILFSNKVVLQCLHFQSF